MGNQKELKKVKEKLTERITQVKKVNKE